MSDPPLFRRVGGEIPAIRVIRLRGGRDPEIVWIEASERGFDEEVCGRFGLIRVGLYTLAVINTDAEWFRLPVNREVTDFDGRDHTVQGHMCLVRLSKRDGKVVGYDAHRAARVAARLQRDVNVRLHLPKALEVA